MAWGSNRKALNDENEQEYKNDFDSHYRAWGSDKSSSFLEGIERNDSFDDGGIGSYGNKDRGINQDPNVNDIYPLSSESNEG